MTQIYQWLQLADNLSGVLSLIYPAREDDWLHVYSTSSPGLVHEVFSSIMAGVGEKESSLDSLEARQFLFPKQSLQFKGHYSN